jgi:hypothetical protein
MRRPSLLPSSLSLTRTLAALALALTAPLSGGACGRAPAASSLPPAPAEAFVFPIASTTDLGAGVERSAGEAGDDGAASTFELGWRGGRRQQQTCISEYGKTACGYHCIAGYGKVACAKTPMGATASACGITGYWDPPAYVRRWYRDAGPAASCLAAYGEIACGYDCTAEYGQVRCAVEPEAECLAGYGDIACGYDCTAAYGEVACASTSDGVCTAAYGDVTCSD